MQLIYGGKTKRSLPWISNIIFCRIYSKPFVKHWKIPWDFWQIIFPYLEKKKDENGLPNEQHSLVIMDTFKRQDNDMLKEFCSKKKKKRKTTEHAHESNV